MKMEEIKEAILDMLQFIFKPVDSSTIWKWIHAEYPLATRMGITLAIAELENENKILYWIKTLQPPLYSLNRRNLDKKDKYAVYKKVDGKWELRLVTPFYSTAEHLTENWLSSESYIWEITKEERN